MQLILIRLNKQQEHSGVEQKVGRLEKSLLQEKMLRSEVELT